MADIAPFRGILYAPERVSLDRVLAPPYDVIDPDERARLTALDPHNSVGIELPEGDDAARYGRAAERFETWQREGVLARDAAPAIYRYHQTFRSAELGELPVTRKGFIAAVRLHRYDEAVILPHERTLRGPKIDRLELMRATGAHTSQIFTLYSDPERATDAAFEQTEARPAELEGTTADGTIHRLWRVSEPAVIERVAGLLRDRRLYIADGHHRYETMLAYRDERAGEPASDDGVSPAFGTLFLANIDDPGLVVLPTHRLVHGLPGFSLDAMVERALAWFDVQTIANAATDAARVRSLLAERGAAAPRFAAVVPGSSALTLLSLRPGVDPEAVGVAGPSAVARLDVSLLHELVLERVLGITREAQEAQTNLRYVKDTAKALTQTAAGEGQVCFLMNPTPVAQVVAVADSGACMPQKSTFFYPKIASGIVFRTTRR